MNRLGLLGSLGVLALMLALAAAALLGSGHGVTEPGSTSSELVIPPGREGVVLEMLHAFGATFAGHSLGDVRVEQREIRVALAGVETGAACPGPAWVRSPGGLRLRYRDASTNEAELSDPRSGQRTHADLTLAWFVCASDGGPHAIDDEAARALERARAAVDPGLIWGRAGAAPTATSEASGLLTPSVRATGLGPGLLSALTWFVGFALALAAPYAAGAGIAGLFPAPIAPPSSEAAARRRLVLGVAIGLLLAGVALRVGLAANGALDGDESWSFPTSHPVFTEDHDAWVHPPLFRVLEGRWGAAIGWHPGNALLALRAPSVLAACAALALVALAVLRSGALLACAPLVVVALSPIVAADGAIARPYGFAAALVTLVAYLLITPPSAPDSLSSPPRSASLSVSLTLVAFGVAIWTDLVAGLIAAALLGLSLSRPGVGWRARVVVVVAAAAWAAPLVPGALVALATQISPAAMHAGAAAPDLAPVHGLGHGAAPQALSALLSFAVLGVPLESIAIAVLALGWLVAIAGAARRAGALREAAAPLAAIAIVGVVAAKVGLRTRNVLFLPHLVAIASAPHLPRLRAFVRRVARREAT